MEYNPFLEGSDLQHCQAASGLDLLITLELLTEAKPHAGRLVVVWLTTSVSLLLYVLSDFHASLAYSGIHPVPGFLTWSVFSPRFKLGCHNRKWNQ